MKTPEPRGLPGTTESLVEALRALGVREGQVVMVHSSLSSLGFVVGGSHAVIDALLAAVGERGTLVMPAHSGDLSEPAYWAAPPVPQRWWQLIRETMPAFDKVKTSTYRMGAIAEAFRHWPGTLRSDHPTGSFAANGAHAQLITEEHALDDAFGESSPLAKLYALDAYVLLIGVSHDRNTSLHLAERRALATRQKLRTMGVPRLVHGHRQWVEYQEPDVVSDDFARLGEALERETQHVSSRKLIAATARWMSQRALIDYGVSWLSRHRQPVA